MNGKDAINLLRLAKADKKGGDGGAALIFYLLVAEPPI